MKIKFDGYTSGQGFVMECKVIDKGYLTTDKIFIHKSLDDSFVKVATLNDLDIVPDVRYTQDYYRKNFCLIILPTVSEAKEIKETISSDINSLALEMEYVKNTFSSEEELEYPLTSTPPTNVEKLYNEYIKIKEEYESYISEREQLTAQKDQLRQTLDTIKALFDPIFSKLASPGVSVDEYRKTLQSLSELKPVVEIIKNNIDTVAKIKDDYASSTRINTYQELISQFTSDVNPRLQYNHHILPSDKTFLTDFGLKFAEANLNLSLINSKITTLIDSITKAYMPYAYLKTNSQTITLSAIFDTSSLDEVITQVNAMISQIESNYVTIFTLSNLVTTMIDKFNKDIRDIEDKILAVNTNIDLTLNAIDELKSRILDENPDFNLELF